MQNWQTTSDWSIIHERKWFFVSADVGRGGTHDKALRTSAWEATIGFEPMTSDPNCVANHSSVGSCTSIAEVMGGLNPVGAT